MRIKICCISSREEAAIAIKYGASALGLVSEMPSGPGVIPEKMIREIAMGVPPGISTFLLTSKTSVDEIIAQQKRCCTNTIQLVEAVSKDTVIKVREELPGVKIVKVIHIEDNKSVDEALSFSVCSDALLLDSGNTKLPVKKLGGTGKTHDWSLSKKIVENSKCPIFLAGGLHPENIQKAIEIVRPFGVDICTGVRTNGQLDKQKLELFMNRAFAA